MFSSRSRQQAKACHWGGAGLFLLFVTFGGCSRSLKFTVTGHEPMNTAGSNSNPVVVRVYQLQTDAKFRQATFETLWRDGAKALGESLLKMDEYTVHPKEVLPLKLKTVKGVKFIGVATDFFRPEKDRWRLILPVSNPKDLHIIESRILDSLPVKK